MPLQAFAASIAIFMLSFLSQQKYMTSAFKLASRLGVRNVMSAAGKRVVIGAMPRIRPLLKMASMAALSVASSTLTTTNKAPVECFRLDYKKSEYLITDIFLSFDLNAESTTVQATSTVQLNTQFGSVPADLVLDGEELALQSVALDGKVLGPNDYATKDDKLIIFASAIQKLGLNGDERITFKLETTVKIHPDKNLALSGLYKSGSNLLCTQCEAMGFRRIAYHLDRPDILTKYTVRLEADKEVYPTLLSNGNKIDGGDLNGGRHWALWEDPYPKPSYLFAVVAGSLGSIHDTYVTKSGRTVQLGIFRCD